MLGLASRISLAGLMVGAVALGGCATVESVQHAQATADQALSQAQAAETAAQKAQGSADSAAAAAQAAQSAAQRAQSTADAAASAAQSAASAAQAAATDAHNANDRLDHLTPSVQHLAHHHRHHTWANVSHHRRHVTHRKG